MDFPPDRRVNGARALARAFVLQAEALTRIKHLTMPGYRRLSMDRLHLIVTQVHALCRDTAWTIADGDEPMPEPSKFAPMKPRFWTAHGKNEQNEELHVGLFPEKRDAAQWCDRQNETQHDQEWGRGSAGPMHFVPKPLYNDPGLTVGAPNPKRAMYPERRWDQTDADQV